MKTVVFGARLCAVTCSVFAFLETPPAGRADPPPVCTWTGSGGDGQWTNPANWNPYGVPSSNAVAVIHSGQVDATVLGPFRAYGLDLNGGTLITAGLTVQVLNQRGGTLTGTNGVAAEGGVWNWFSGWVNGTGLIPAGGVMNLRGADSKYMGRGTTIENAGTIDWLGPGTLMGYCYDAPATVNNRGQAVFRLSANGTVTGRAYSYKDFTLRFDDGSALVKTSDGLDSLAGVVLDCAGGIQVDAGVVQLDTLAAFRDGARLAGNGSIRMYSGQALIEGILTLDRTRWEQAGASCTAGSGGATIQSRNGGTVDWSAGYLYGRLTLTNGLESTWSGSGEKHFGEGAELHNHGSIRWTGGPVYGRCYSAGATVQNHVGARFTVEGGASLNRVYRSQPARFVVDAGAEFVKNGTGALACDWAFTNDGRSTITDGGMTLTSGGASTGGVWALGPSASLGFADGTYHLAAATALTGTGIVRLAGGQVTPYGRLTLDGVKWQQVGGNFAMAAEGAWIETANGATVEWAGGWLHGTLTLTNGVESTWSGTAEKYFGDGATLHNYGTIRWTGGMLYGRCYLGGATFQTHAGGRFLAEGGRGLARLYTYQPANLIVDAGAEFAKTAGGDVGSDWQVVNNGSARIAEGALRLYAGGGSAGTWQVAKDGLVDFSGGTYGLGDGIRFAGEGTARLSGSYLGLSGTLPLDGVKWEQTGGTFATGAGGGLIQTANGAALEWSGGWLQGTLTLTNGVASTWSGTAEKYFGDGTTLHNYGTIRWTGGMLYGRCYLGGATIQTRAGGRFLAEGGRGLARLHTYQPANLIVDAGVEFAKTAGGDVGSDWQVVNNGAARIAEGSLRLYAGGGSTGTWQVAKDGLVDFVGGSYGLGEGIGFAGAGTVRLSGSYLGLTGTLPLDGVKWQQTGGTFATGAGGGLIQTANGAALEWSGGWLQGTLTLTNGVASTWSGTAEKYFGDGATLHNYGTIRWTGGTLYGRCYLGGATIQTRAGGRFLADGGRGLARLYTYQPANLIVDAGAEFAKTAGGEVGSDWQVFNNGSAQMVEGSLLLHAGGGSTGTWQVAKDALVDFVGGSYGLGGGIGFAGEGTVRLSGGYTGLSGTLPLDGVRWEQTGGTFATGAGGGLIQTVNGAALEWSGGWLQGSLMLTNGVESTWSGTAEKYFGDGATLHNHGVIRWTGGPLYGRCYTGGTTVRNHAGGVFEVRSSVGVGRLYAQYPASFINDGTLRLGTPGGGVAGDWSVVLNAGGVLDLALAGTNAVQDFGRWIAGSIAVDGTVRAIVQGEFAPASGDVFPFLTAGSVSGRFAREEFEALPAGLGWVLEQDQTTLALRVEAAAGCALPPSGLAGWWSGDGHARDLMGTNHGILRNGAGFGPGVVSRAFALDGTDDYITVGDLAVLDSAKGLTVMAWVQERAEDGRPAGIVGKWDTSGNPANSFLLYNGEASYAGRGAFGLRFDDGTGASVAGTTPIPAGQWVHVAATWRNSDGRVALYKNGVIESTTTAGIGRSLYTHRAYPAAIGEWGVVRSSRYKFNGWIDEVAVFGRALSAEDIAAIAGRTGTGWCRSQLPPSIVVQPADLTVLAGRDATFTLAVIGSGPMRYQWRFGAADLPDATNATLRLVQVQPGQAGLYSVVVANLYGSTVSSNAVLTVRGDTVPPRIVRLDPAGLVNRPVDRIEVEFDERIDPATFTGADLVLLGPTGAVDPADFTVQPAAPNDGTAFEVFLGRALAQGAYTLAVGPEITDEFGNRMAVAASGAFMLDLTGPRVLAVVPSGDVSNRVTEVEVRFDSAVQAATFTAADARLAGAGGPSVVAVQVLSSNRFQLRFGAPLPAGPQSLVIGPDVLDLAGNPMDQDGDGLNGEPTEDASRIAFTVHWPDLVPVTVSGPAAALAGQDVPLVVTIENAGQAVAEPPWQAWILLATRPDGALTVTLRALDINDALPPGARLVLTQRVAFPAGVFGERYPGVRVDTAGQILELDETNNTLLAGAPIRILAPNLTAGAVGVAGTPRLGEAVDVAWESRNTGDGPADGLWLERVHLSPLPGLSGATVLGQWTNTASLASAAAVFRQLRLRLPLSRTWPPGTYYLVVAADAENRLLETNETDNLGVSAALSVEWPPLPDLAVTDIEGPPTALGGQTVSLRYVLTNQGTATTAAVWRETVSLSTDTAAGSDLPVAGFSAATLLAPGQSLVRTQSVTLPSGVLGDRYFVVAVDTQDEVFESNETNNTAVAGRALRCVAPDLMVESVSGAGSGRLGEPFELTWVVRNAGVGEARGVWRERLALSTSPQGTAGYDLGWFTNLSLVLPGESVARRQSVLLPLLPAFGPGTYYLVVATDADNALLETDETNNTGRSPPVTLAWPALPDLVVGDLGGPAQALWGQSATFSWAVTNAGTAPAAGGWRETVVLATDAGGGGAQGLATFVFTNRLEAGQWQARTQTLTLPANERGLRYWRVEVDTLDTVLETNETNNAPPTRTRLLLTSPDLRVAAVSLPDGVHLAEPAEVTWVVANAGDGWAGGGWVDGLYLSNRLGVLCPLGLPVGNVSQLAPGDRYTNTATVHLPRSRDFPPGTYAVVVKADSDAALRESDEDNNTTAGSVVALDWPALPDLAAEILLAPDRALWGQAASLTWLATNIGTAAATGGWRETVYLAATPDAVSGPVLLSLVLTNGLVAGDGAVRTRVVTLPAGTLGLRYLGVSVDPDDALIESNETNNTALAAQPIRILAPDLTVESVTGPGTIRLGEPLGVGWTVRNVGDGEAAGAWLERIFLSSQPGLGGALRIGEWTNTATLDAGARAERQRQVTLPLDRAWAPGTYYVIVTADAVNAVVEASETNNTTASPAFEAGWPALPDLAATRVDGPPEALWNSPVLVSWAATNRGTASADGRWLETVSLATNAAGSGGRLLGTFSWTNRIPAGDALTRTQQVVLPGNTRGAFYLVAALDAQDNLLESDEGNNRASAAVPIRIVAPDLEVTNVTAVTPGEFGRTLAVSWETLNTGDGPAAGHWLERVYFSPTPGLAGAVAVGSFTNTVALEAGARAGRQCAVTLPLVHGLPVGNWYLRVQADALAEVAEIDETNNAAASPAFAVGYPDLPDLVIPQLVVPANPAFGQRVELAWVVSNQGPARVAGVWTETVDLAADRNGDRAQRLAEFTVTNTIDPGEAVLH